MGRPTSSPNGSFGYNKEGQLTLASNSYGAYSLTYDDGGRVTLVTEPDSLTLNFGYDKAGNRTLVTDSLGGTELSTYDDANFLTSRMYQGQGQILGVQFTNNAEDWNTTLARYGNGTLVATGETGYDNVGQATTILNTHGTATVDQFLNAYNNGNVTSVIGTQNGSTTTLGLTYDEDNELTGAGTTSYTFDSNGNRTGSAGVTTGNELTSDATWSYTYDADGNLIQKSKGVGGTIITTGLGGGGGGGLGGGETWTYGYNPQDQLTQVQHFTGPLVTLALTVDYGYDAFGNRIETTSIASGTTTVTKDAYDGWDPGQPAPTGNENFNVWAQTNASGTLTSRYLYSDRVDQQLGRIDVTAGTATIYWTLEDYQNSVRDVIDNTGALKDSIQYDAFGNITSETDPTYRGSYAWTGRELDAETDLQYNHARWYDATTGRWMTQDPLGFDAGDSNLYRYVNNPPTEATDPSGSIAYGFPGTLEAIHHALFGWIPQGMIIMTTTDGDTTETRDGMVFLQKVRLLEAVNRVAVQGRQVKIKSLVFAGHGGPEGVEFGDIRGAILTVDTRMKSIHVQFGQVQAQLDITTALRAVTDNKTVISFRGCKTADFAKDFQSALGNGAMCTGWFGLGLLIPATGVGAGIPVGSPVAHKPSSLSDLKNKLALFWDEAPVGQRIPVLGHPATLAVGDLYNILDKAVREGRSTLKVDERDRYNRILNRNNEIRGYSEEFALPPSW